MSETPPALPDDPPPSPPAPEAPGQSGRVCITATNTGGLETEVAARLTAMKLEPVFMPMDAPGAVQHGTLEHCGALVSLYPLGPTSTMAMGIAAGLKLPVFVLSSDPDPTPYPKDTRVFTTVQALVDAVPSIEQRFVDNGLLKRLGACEEGMNWYNSRYPGGAHAKDWSAKEQVAALKEGGARWLKTGFDHRLIEHLSMAGHDFTDADLTDLRLSKGDLTGAILVNANLTGAQIIATALVGADVSGAELTGAALKRCDITGVKAVKTRLQNTTFDLCQLDRADGSGAMLDRARPSRTSFVGVKFTGASLADMAASDCRFDSADFSGADLGRAHFTRCQFRGADFRGADLKGVVFIACDLAQADLTDVDLNETLIQP